MFALPRLAVSVALFTTLVSACAAAPLPKDDGATRIVAIGDSFVHGGARPKQKDHRNQIRGGWVSRLGERLSAHHESEKIEVFNEGVTGDTTYALQQRLDKSLFAYEPDIVLLGIGSNDINANWMGWFGKSLVGPTAKDVSSYQEVLDEIFQQIAKQTPKARVFIVGMTTPVQRYWRESFWGFTINMPDQITVAQMYSDYNAILAQTALDYGFNFIDVASQWPDASDESWALYADGIHPNDKGYERMAEIISSAILDNRLVSRIP